MFRSVIVALLAFWLAFGPVVDAWAQADQPCESMSMSVSADDCCGGGMDQAKCLSACLSAAPAMAVPATHAEVQDPGVAVVIAPSFRHRSVLAPPDIAPPKTFVS